MNQTSNTQAQAAKVLRAKYGVHGVPTPATKVYVKDMAFDHDGVNKNSDGSTTEKIETKSWILITPDGRRCHLNTYNGEVGAKVDPANFTYDALPPKEMAKKLKKYREVAISECPFAIAPAATGTEQPTTPAPEAPKGTLEESEMPIEQ
jgi:hypothetical protein